MMRTVLFTISLLLPLLAQAEGPVISSASFLAWDYDSTAVGVDHFAVYLSRTPVAAPDGTPDAIVPFGTARWPIVAQGGQWYAVVTAVGPGGEESDPSNEVPFFVVAAPANLRIEK